MATMLLLGSFLYSLAWTVATRLNVWRAHVVLFGVEDGVHKRAHNM